MSSDHKPGSRKTTRRATSNAVPALASLRESRGFTQAELATRTGVSTLQISQFETGFRSPSVPTLIRLADALDVSLDALTARATGVPAEKPGGPRIRALIALAAELSGRDLDVLVALAGVLKSAGR